MTTEHPTRGDFIRVFGDGDSFSGKIFMTDEDDQSWRLENKCWTWLSYEDLRMTQFDLYDLTPEAFAYFLPAYVFEAMTDLNGEELDWKVLSVFSAETICDRLPYTPEQWEVLERALRYIENHSVSSREFPLGETLLKIWRLRGLETEEKPKKRERLPPGGGWFPYSIPRTIRKYMRRPPRVSELEALRIAKAHVKPPEGFSVRPCSVHVLLDSPKGYTLRATLKDPFWAFFAPWCDGRDGMMLRSSRVVLVSRGDSSILYDGSAEDEG